MFKQDTLMNLQQNMQKSKKKWMHTFLVHILWSNLAFTQVAYGQTVDPQANQEAQKIEVKNEEQLKENQTNADANINHDVKAYQDGKPNATQCRSIHDAAQDNYDMLVKFQQTYMQQGIDQLNSKINQLKNNTNSMVGAEGGLVGDPVNSMGITLEQYNKYRADLPAAEQRLNTAEANLQSAQARYNDCTDNQYFGFCSIAEKERRRVAMEAAQKEKDDAQQDYNKISNAIRVYRNQAVANSNQSVNNAYSDANKQDATSHSQFGVNEAYIAVYNSCKSQFPGDDAKADACVAEAEKNNPNLAKGSGNANYNQLTQMYNSTTASAQDLAVAMVEKVRNQELQATFNSDYRLYELAVDDFPADDSYKYLNSASTFSKKKMLISSMEVLGQTGAAAKDLYCVKHKISEGDSKAYYLFKAAAATYVSAEINDSRYHSGTAECRAYEDFSDDDKDMQVRAVERAANLYDEMYEQLCLKINPTNEIQARECDKYLTQIYGDYFKDGAGGYMRTREKALDILNLSLDAAYAELQDKMQKVSTAHANVKKGEAWIKKDLKIIATLTALLAVLYGVNSICPGCCGCVSPKISYVIAAINFYMFTDLIKARAFTAMWKRKRDVARHFTHLVCNQDASSATEVANLCRTESGNSYTKNEICMQLKSGMVTKVKDAFSEEDQIRAFADETRKLAQEAIDKERQKVKDMLPAEFVQQQEKTSYLPDPSLEVKALAKIAGTNGGYQAALGAYDWLRIRKGAISSLRYDDVLPPPEFIDDELKKFGLELKKTVIKGARSVAEVMFPEARAAAEITEDKSNMKKEVSCSASDQSGGKTDLVACSVGVLKGSTSFSYFLVRRNRGWQNQALDVTRSSSRVPTGINYMATTSGSLQNEVNALPIENQTGMAIPETRINTIMNLIKTITEHMALSRLAMDELYLQRQEYITLLDRMKRRLNLGIEGLDDFQEIPKQARSMTCMSMQGGEFSVDPKCSCKTNNSCSTFAYPTFDGPGAVSSDSQMAFDLADASLSGNMEKANLSAGSLSQNAAKVKRRLGNSLDLYNQNRLDNGLPSLDDLVNQQRDIERQKSYDSFASLSPALAKFETKQNDSGNLLAKSSGSYAKMLKDNALTEKIIKDDSLANGKKDESVTAKYESGKGVASAGSSSSSKGDGEKSDSLIDFDFKADGEDTIGNEFAGDISEFADGALYSGNGSNKDLRALNDGGTADEFFGSNGSGRSPASATKKRSQINENAKVSIFKIISKRYERSAYPVLLKRKVDITPP